MFENLYEPVYIYETEDKDLLVEQKNNLIDKMNQIYKKLSEKNNIDEFLNEEDDEELSEEDFEIAKSFGKCRLFVTIKCLGALLFIFHLITIYEISSIINAIEEELMASARSYLKREDRDSTDDFYQNFNQLNNKLPDYSVFFISSFLSKCLNEVIGYETLTILTSIINLLVLFFGFTKFEFNLERNHYENYSLNEFFYLYVIYFILCFSQGIVALYPLDIIKDGFIFYDKFNEKNIKLQKIDYNKPNNSEKENSEHLINQKEANDEKPNNDVKKTLHKLKGFFLFYLICITSSILIKILLDKIFIGEYNYSSREKVNQFFIYCYFICTYISLFLHRIYSYIIVEKKEEEKKQSITSMKLLGYIIYNESKPNEDICCCYNCYNCCECFEDCKICCQTLNMSLCCYMCNCICCFKTLFCCQCKKCEENNKFRIRENNDINKIERIFVFYRVTGRWNWLAKVMTDIQVYPLALVLYYILITNMGFEDIIWNNNEKNENNNEYIINIVILGAISFFYFINKYGGKCIIDVIDKVFNKGNGDFRNAFECPGDFTDIFIGFIPYILIQTILSIILSGLIYFASKDINIYILSITIASEEYIKINILEIISFFIETNFKTLEFFTSSTIFSIYLFIWDFLKFILSLFDVENKRLILFQFIIGIVVVAPFIFITLWTSIILCCFHSEIFDEDDKIKDKDIGKIEIKSELKIVDDKEEK